MPLHVPDRLDLEFYPAPRASHSGRAKTLIWFGFIHNAHETLEKMIPTIEKYNLKLKIIANLPYSKTDRILSLNPEYHNYNHSTAYDLIKTGDIVLNPKSDLSFFKYKSNNKSIISWKLGLPVAEDIEQLELLMDPEERNKQVETMRWVVENEYDINQSAAQYRQIIEQIKERFFCYSSV